MIAVDVRGPPAAGAGRQAAVRALARALTGPIGSRSAPDRHGPAPVIRGEPDVRRSGTSDHWRPVPPMDPGPAVPTRTASRADQRRAAGTRSTPRPGFGRYFTDHMVLIDYDAGRGLARPAGGARTARSPSTRPRWCCTTARRSSRGSRSTRSPTARSPRSGRKRTRPGSTGSADRLGMPRLPEELFLASIRGAAGRRPRVGAPPAARTSLYLRPFMIATEVGLGRAAVGEYLYCVIASPAGPYFPRWREAGRRVAVHRVRAGRAGRHGRGQVRRQLRGLAGCAGAGRGAGLRPGRLARRRGAPLGRGDGRR